MYLLDTNILIYAYRNLGQCRARIDAQDAANINICPINVTEIEYGIAKSTRPDALKQFLATIQLLYVEQAFTTEAARQAGQVRAALERQGQPIGAYDLLIAGIALAHNLTVVTRNVREFSRVPQLKVENWYE